MSEHHEHLEIVEHPGQEQPWHNRIIAGNNEPTWSTETFHEGDSAGDSIVALGRMFSPVHKATVTEYELIVWLDDDEMGAKLVIPIRVTEMLDNGFESSDLSDYRGPTYSKGGVLNPDALTGQLTAIRELVVGWKRAADVTAVSTQQRIAASTLGHVITEVEQVIGEVPT